MKLKNNGGTLKGDLVFNRSGVETRKGLSPYSSIASIEVINSTSKQKQGGWLGRAVVGEVLLGPVGAIIGAVTRKSVTENNISFMVTFNSGETFFTTCGVGEFHNFYGTWQRKRHESEMNLAAFSGKGKFGSFGSNLIQVAATLATLFLMFSIFG